MKITSKSKIQSTILFALFAVLTVFAVSCGDTADNINGETGQSGQTDTGAPASGDDGGDITQDETEGGDMIFSLDEILSMDDDGRGSAVAAAEAEYGSLFSGVRAAKSYKSNDESNPLIVQRFGADPFAMEYDGRVYVYTTNDIYEYNADGSFKSNSYGKVNTLNCWSSADMVNWCDHGVVNVAKSSRKICKWANNSWAPAACWREIDGKPKFFLYFANSAGGIGVMTSDSPTGPWTDPLGHELITKQTPGCSGVVWMFDPAVFIDDDGQAYIYFGGGIPNENYSHPMTARVAKLGDDMISVTGPAETIDAPFFFEDSGINKINGKYIYSYCLNWSDDKRAGNEEKNPAAANIGIMTSDSPTGPFTYAGTIMKNPGNFFGLYGNNHHCMINFKGEYYMFYHTQLLDKLINGETHDYRATFVNKVRIGADGKISPITMTKDGVAQVGVQNPYTVVEAEMLASSGGIDTKEISDASVNFTYNMALCDTKAGSFSSVRGADFGGGAAALTIRAACNAETGGVIKVTLDKQKGEVAAYVHIPATGGDFVEVTVPVTGSEGIRDVYFTYSGEGIEVDCWQFVQK